MCLIINVSIPRHCIPADVAQPSNYFPRVKKLSQLCKVCSALLRDS
eukprot:COSAG01_NODE_1871_length_9009_cov_5.036139_6_plen_46_part_00